MDAHHVPSLKLYFTVFGILMVGTALTVLVAFFDLGAMNNVVMLTIAIVKALFVVLYFMHVRCDVLVLRPTCCVQRAVCDVLSA